MLDGLGKHTKKSLLAKTLTKLAPRWFVMRDAKGSATSLLHPRHAIAYLRGPMTQAEIRRVRGAT